MYQGWGEEQQGWVRITEGGARSTKDSEVRSTNDGVRSTKDSGVRSTKDGLEYREWG